MRKTVVLNICSFRAPFALYVSSNCGDYRIINVRSTRARICFNTNGCYLKLRATQNGKTFYQTIWLDERMCQNYCVSFPFDTDIAQKVLSEISLTDENYGFPVFRAVLNFNQDE